MIHAPSGLQQMSIFTTAAQSHLSSSVVVFIKVLDINDNVPRLARDYQPYICEGTQAGEVCILWCTDVHDLLYYSCVELRISMKWTVKVLILQHIVLHQCSILDSKGAILQLYIPCCIHNTVICWLRFWEIHYNGMHTGDSTCSFSVMGLCVSQLIQLLSAVDPDDPVEGHHFYFSMVPEKHINPNFTIRDNQGYY